MAQRRDSNAAPAELARFDPADWPGDTLHDRLLVWESACFAWLADHPDGLPFGYLGCRSDVRFAVVNYPRGLGEDFWGRRGIYAV